MNGMTRREREVTDINKILEILDTDVAFGMKLNK